MCGRYSLSSPDADLLSRRFELREAVEVDDEPRYNIAPTDPVLAVRRMEDGGNELGRLRWGLVPGRWAEKGGGRPLINARAETLESQPAFRESFAQRRCLIPADGFYEWQKRGKAPSQPIYVRRRDGGLFAFAGLWEEWKTPDSELAPTCTIITVEPNELISQFHQRMAAILKPDDEDLWIDPGSKTEDLLRMLRPYSSDELEAFPVSRAVNRPSFDDAACIAPIETKQIE